MKIFQRHESTSEKIQVVKNNKKNTYEPNEITYLIDSLIYYTAWTNNSLEYTE